MTPADELRAAAETLDDLTEAAARDMKTNGYWACYQPDTAWRDGFANGFGGAPGDLAGLFGPEQARALSAVFTAWARMAEWDADLLNRVGGDETLALARAVLGSRHRQEQP
ncbi:hypothetical protein ACWGOK_39255 [Streptomyces eurythermus]